MRLSLAARVHLSVLAAFALVMLVTLLMLLRQAEKDVMRELESGRALAVHLFAGLTREADPQSLAPLQRIRHVRLDRPGRSMLREELEFPGWLLTWMAPAIERSFPPSTLSFTDGQQWVISADPHDELEEVWESVLLLLGVFAVALLLSHLVIHLGLHRGLLAYRNLLLGLQQIRGGDLRARMESSQQPELNHIAERFNGMAAALQRAEASNRQLTHALMNLQERERAELAHALHDDLGQYLTGIRAQAYMLREAAERPEYVRDHGGRLLEACDGLQQGFRRLVRELHPVVLERMGLEQALRQLTEQWQHQQQIRCDLELAEDLPELPAEARTHLYRLLQEALNNVARHAQANQVQVRLACRHGVMEVSVQDNGRGLSTGDTSEPGLGLLSMQERARCLNGLLTMITRPGRGLLLLLEIPLAGVPS